MKQINQFLKSVLKNANLQILGKRLEKQNQVILYFYEKIWVIYNDVPTDAMKNMLQLCTERLTYDKKNNLRIPHAPVTLHILHNLEPLDQ